MNSICSSFDTLFLNPLIPHKTDLHSVKPSILKLPSSKSHRRCLIRSTSDSSASTSEVNMVRNKQGIYTPKLSKVVILWDLDNKPPRGPPYEAAMALRNLASKFGDVIDMSAYANRHAFNHLPQWVVEERRERKQLDILERKGMVAPPAELYVCGVCGRKCKTNLDLKKHFKQLHEREREKKMNRMRSLKGKKRQKYKEKFITGNYKYEESARSLIKPKVGHGLAAELRRAGFFVKTVEDKPQAADWALKRQMQHSMSRGVDWLFLISDDGDFGEMLRKAREADLGTVVVGDVDRVLGRHADVWVSWGGVENGEVTEKDLVQRNVDSEMDNDGFFSLSSLDDDESEIGSENGFDRVIDELIVERTEFGGAKMSAFSDGEEEAEEDDDHHEEEEEDDDEDYLLMDEEDEFF